MDSYEQLSSISDAIEVRDLTAFHSALEQISSVEELGWVVDDFIHYCDSSETSEEDALTVLKGLILITNHQDQYRLFSTYLGHLNEERPNHTEYYKSFLNEFKSIGFESREISRALVEHLENRLDKDHVDLCGGDYSTIVDLGIVKFFLDQHADPNYLFSRYASFDDQPEDIDPTEVTSPIGTVVNDFDPSIERHKALLDLMISRGGDLRVGLIGSGDTPLCRLQKAWYEIVLEPNTIAQDGQTDLTRELVDIPFKRGTTASLKYTLNELADAGADFNICNGEKRFPLELLIESIMMQLKVGRPHESVLTPLPLIDLMLEKGANTKLVLDSGETLLTYTIKLMDRFREDYFLLEMAQLIIQKIVNSGVSIWDKNTCGETAVDLIIRRYMILVPYIRNLAKGTPKNITESIFLERDKCLKKNPDLMSSFQSEDIAKAFAYATRFKCRQTIEALLDADIDALDSLRWMNTGHFANNDIKFSRADLNLLAKSPHPKLAPLWEYVLKNQDSKTLITLASEQIPLTAGDEKAHEILKSIKHLEKSEDSEYELIKEQTKVFIKQVKTVIEELGNDERIYAFDLHNNGYAPGEMGSTIFDVILSNEGEEAIGNTQICWVDTKHSRKSLQESYGKGKLLEALREIRVYYDASTDDLMSELTEKICDTAESLGLEVDWNGHFNQAILLKKSFDS